MTNSYDVVSYPTVPRVLAHPSHLHAVARMFGVAAPPVGSCRVLEIGCGEAMHLVACAVSMPDATFIGIDFSSEAVARGNQLIERVGLKNIQLEVADIATWEPPSKPFDYVLAHGIYSWIPVPIRNAMLALIRRALSPHGVACVSYNTYPGSYTRQMLWEMMKYHIQGIDEPQQKIDQAKQLAEFVRISRQLPEGAEPGLFDSDIATALNSRREDVLYHDDLSDVNDPVYFHQFVKHVAEHGLKFVAEAEPHSMGNGDLPPEAAKYLHTLAIHNPERREQYYDFATVRRFRQSIITQEPHQQRGTPNASAIRELYLTGNAGFDTVDLSPNTPMKFQTESSYVVYETVLAKAAMVVLVECRPQRISFPELLQRTQQKLSRESFTDDEVEELLSELVVAWTTGLVLLKGHVPAYVTTISERPVSSPLARVQLAGASHATTLLHMRVQFDDAQSRLLVQLLDGTRTIDEIAAEVYASFSDDHRPSEADFRAGLQRNLSMLALSGLLMA